MPGPRIKLAAHPEFTSFDYAQTPVGQERVVAQLDHALIADGQWRRVSTRSEAYYRCVNGFYQQVQLADEPFGGALHSALEIIEHAGPLHTDDIVEVVIRVRGRGFEMTSELICLSDGARFMEFTPTAWNAAYVRLLNVEDVFDPDSVEDA